MTPHLRFAVVLGFALTNVAIAQETANLTSAPKNSSEVNHILDQLIEQNQRLEKQNEEIEKQNKQLKKQNQELMGQINGLRSGGAPRANVAAETVLSTSVGVAAGEKVGQTGPSSAPEVRENDDKTILPEATEGNSAIFGEFNPGRGFTVAKG